MCRERRHTNLRMWKDNWIDSVGGRAVHSFESRSVAHEVKMTCHYLLGVFQQLGPWSMHFCVSLSPASNVLPHRSVTADLCSVKLIEQENNYRFIFYQI